MYKKILIPLDGSKRAEAILPHVEEMAQRYKSEVIFFRVVEHPPVVTTPGQPDMTHPGKVIEQRKEEAELYLKKLQGEFEQKGIQASIAVQQGTIVKAIINEAERRSVDLIALASHGRSGLGQVFYGSVAAGVLQRVDRPLLLIRSRDE
jgi:nucleotide-binding universal stress UspA family protein